MPNNPSLSRFVENQNAAKVIFTPGPSSLTVENLVGLGPAFGRGDPDYDDVESKVMSKLRALAGQEKIARLQGSASLAIEIMVTNFLFGRVFVVETGFYSDRLLQMVKSTASHFGNVVQVDYLPLEALRSRAGHTDWVVAAPVETSKALRLPISDLKVEAERLGARLMLDATASIGLEIDHDLADVLAFSSCKGLFGLTGGAFLAYSATPSNDVSSFSLSLTSHFEKRMTGPYHTIMSLFHTLSRHDELKYSVVANKNRCLSKFEDNLLYPPDSQPLLCTGLAGKIRSSHPRAVLYSPRGRFEHSVVCHLGEVHLGMNSLGAILDYLYLEK